MNFKTVEFTLTANVADDGTFTVSYPAGFDDGDFENAVGHYLVLNGDRLDQPNDIGLSFGDTSVTVTNRTGAALVAAKGYFTFMLNGKDSSREDRAVFDPSKDVTGRVKLLAKDAGVLLINLSSPVTADADGILDGVSATDSAQTYTSADFVSTFTGTLDVARNIVLTGTAGSNHVVTVRGFDEYDQPMREAITLNGTNAVAGVKAFKRVTQFDVAAGAAGDTFDAGWGDVLGLPVFVDEATKITHVIENGVTIGNPNADVIVPFEIDATKYAAGTSEFVISPVAGTIEEVQTVAVTATTGAGAIGVELDGTAVTGLSVVVATGTAVGGLDSDTPTTPGSATTVVDKGEAIEITGDGTPTAGALRGFIRIRPTSVINGTLVVADRNTEATATSADVRGTFDPATACDGTTNFSMIAVLPQPSIGGEQYNG